MSLASVKCSRLEYPPVSLLRPCWLLACLLLMPCVCAAQSTPAQGSAGGANVSAAVTLPSGLRVLCRRESGAPLVAINIFVRTDDTLARNPALGSLLARTLLLSTTNVSTDSLATQISDLGGSVNATWQTDALQISALVVRDRFRDASFLLADVLRNADFDPQGAGVDDARQQLLSDQDTASASPFAAGYAAVRKTLYAGSPYALPALGTEADAERLTRADLLRAYSRAFVPSHITVAVVGDIDPSYALRKISDDLSDFPPRPGSPSRTGTPPFTTPTPLTATPAPVRLSLPDLSEVCVIAGFQTPGSDSADYPALLVANALLGGLKTSRLFTALREKMGLGYEVGSGLSVQAGSGDLIAFALAAPLHTDPATKKSAPSIPLLKTQILRQCDALKTTPPTAAQVQRAQRYLLGSDKIRRERLEDRAALLGLETLQHGDAAAWEAAWTRRLQAVTPADVQRVASEYFVHPAIVVVAADTKGP